MEQFQKIENVKSRVSPEMSANLSKKRIEVSDNQKPVPEVKQSSAVWSSVTESLRQNARCLDPVDTKDSRSAESQSMRIVPMRSLAMKTANHPDPSHNRISVGVDMENTGNRPSVLKCDSGESSREDAGDDALSAVHSVIATKSSEKTVEDPHISTDPWNPLEANSGKSMVSSVLLTRL